MAASLALRDEASSRQLKTVPGHESPMPVLPLAPAEALMIIIICRYHDYFLNTHLAHFNKLH